MNLPRTILVVYALLFAGVLGAAATFFVGMRRDLTQLRAQEAANQNRLAEATAKLRAQERYLDQLRHDPALVEHLIRQKLGYARAQEFVFRFEDQK